MLTVCFAGLPSAGKSTTINALAGKRVLESGVCRTTTEPCLVGATNTVGAQKWVQTKLESDDGVEFCALDLPGTCDAEDASGSFNKVTLEWATMCDVVVWVTDARTAFSTTHELREYAALRAAIQEKADEDGTLYQFLVVLAKYDVGDKLCASTAGAAMQFLEGEIRAEHEESTIDGNFERVARKFSVTRVAKFSAFARIATRGSETLRALVSASSVYTNGAHGTFELGWATENMNEKRISQMARVLSIARLRVSRLSRNVLDTAFLEFGAARVEFDIFANAHADHGIQIATALRDFCATFAAHATVRHVSFGSFGLGGYDRTRQPYCVLFVDVEWDPCSSLPVLIADEDRIVCVGPIESPEQERYRMDQNSLAGRNDMAPLPTRRKWHMEPGDVFLSTCPDKEHTGYYSRRLPAGACSIGKFDPNPRCERHHHTWRDKLTPNYKTIGIYTGRTGRFSRRFGSHYFEHDMNIHGLLLGKIKDPAALREIGDKLTSAGLVIPEL